MIEFGPFRYDAESRFLYRGDEEIMLPPRVLAVLESLLKRPGKVVAKDAVLESAWEGAFVGEDSLTQAISQLRSALGDDPQRPEYIQTIPKRGYRFIAEVSEALVSLGPVARPVAEEAGAGATGAAAQADAAPKTTGIEAAPSPAAGSPGAPGSPALAAGTAVGNYELVAQIGAGAMGQVWRARDSELQRDVAIKVVPQELAGEAAVIERFRREALMLAAVNHPNIATIHGVEEVNGTPLIVMELLDGETLQERLSGGALPIEDALNIAIQIARALAVAHDAGIVHRDLKPGNIMLGAGNHVKVLDFGLAKDTEADDGEATVDPTLLTASGLLVGTAAYMSPEQAAGKPIDKRSDIFSFGCVLFEMLAGKRPFGGVTASEIVAGILKDEPEWDELPSPIPAGVQRLLQRCLEKEPDQRIHDIADARIEMQAASSEPAVHTLAHEAERPSATLRWTVTFVVVALLVGTLLGRYFPRAETATRPERIEFDIHAPDGHSIDRRNIAISPQGTHIAYRVVGGEDAGLYLRSLDGEVRKVPGTEDLVQNPVFSPDGTSILFRGREKLQRVSVRGGTPTDVVELPGSVMGIDWTEDGTVFAGVQGMGLMRLSPSDEDFELVLAVDTAAGDNGYEFPEILPGGKAVLVDVFRVADADASPIIAYDLETRRRHLVTRAGAHPRYALGHVFFSRGATVYAVPFDIERLEVTGPELSVREGVTHAHNGAGGFDISQTGSLVYSGDPGADGYKQLVWVDRAGEHAAISEDSRRFRTPRISPDDQQLAVADGEGNIWLYDLRRGGNPTLFTSEGVNISPVWSPEGDRIAFSSNRDGPLNIYWQSLDGGEATRWTTSDNPQYATSWSPDGQVLAFEEVRPETGYDIMLLHLEGLSVEAWRATSNMEGHPMFSPSGGWLSYTSDSPGLPGEVYLESFPGRRGRPTRASVNGGGHPIWGGDDTLFFSRGTRVFGLPIGDVGREGSLDPGEPELLFRGSAYGSAYTPLWDANLDGTRFVMLRDQGPPPPNTKLHVFVNLSGTLETLLERMRADGSQ